MSTVIIPAPRTGYFCRAMHLNSIPYFEKTIGEMAAADYRMGLLFKKYGINFYCGGRKQLKEACIEQGLDSRQLEREIFALQNNPHSQNHNFNDWPLTVLIDYMVQVYRKKSGLQHEAIRRLAENLLGAHPQLVRVLNVWNDLGTELMLHLKKEEYVLFPYVKNLEKFLTGELKKFPVTHVSTIKSPIRMMEQEHELMHLMISEAVSVAQQENAAAPLQGLYTQLTDFQEELQQHFHLQNNILFPKAIALEERLSPFRLISV